ncbi:Carboxypeptidase M, partial [Armadillidium nasatum]
MTMFLITSPKIYSFNHKRMHLGLQCKRGAPSFKNGTTNGAAWYPLTGGMQDYNYVWQGCMDITIEISCCKYPPSEELPKFWQENKKALLRYMGEVHRGILGFVRDNLGRPLGGVSLKISGRDVGFQSTKHGEFWRILLPGEYTIEAFLENYHPVEHDFIVNEETPTVLNITLYPLKQ